MTKPFQLKLTEIQPSQLYISTEKLARILKELDPEKLDDLEPIPVKKLGDDIILTDGHTRAFAAYLCGISVMPAYWDDDDLDWEMYEVCSVGWCKEEGINRILDLVGRVVGPNEYKKLWLDRCKETKKILDRTRSQED